MLTILGTIAIILATIGIGLLVDRRWGVISRKDKLLAQQRRPLFPTHAAGEAPATAIEVTERERDRLRRAKCTTCRGAMEPLPDEIVTYDGRDLVVLHARCRACGRARSTYVRP